MWKFENTDSQYFMRFVLKLYFTFTEKYKNCSQIRSFFLKLRCCLPNQSFHETPPAFVLAAFWRFGPKRRSPKSVGLENWERNGVWKGRAGYAQHQNTVGGGAHAVGFARRFGTIGRAKHSGAGRRRIHNFVGGAANGVFERENQNRWARPPRHPKTRIRRKDFDRKSPA